MTKLQNEIETVRKTKKVMDEIILLDGKLFVFIFNDDKNIGDAAVFSWRTIRPEKFLQFLEQMKRMLLISKLQAKLIGPKYLIEKAIVHLKQYQVELVNVIEVETSFEVRFKYEHQKSHKLGFSKVKQINREEEFKNKVINLLVVDDSPTIHKILESLFTGDKKIKIVGHAYNAADVERLVEEKAPDVISLDMYLPGKSGLEIARELLPNNPIPIIILSSLEAKDGGPILEALEEGCCDYMQKPTLANLSQLKIEFREKIIAASQIGAVSIIQKMAQKNIRNSSALKPSLGKVNSLILLGASTGGTSAIAKIFSDLPQDIPPIVIVQHMPAHFTSAFANRLNQISRFTVVEATDQVVLRSNCVYIAPGGKQMKLNLDGQDWRVTLTDDEPVNRFKPSVDYLFKSFTPFMFRKLGGRVLGVLLTGMGADGAQGMAHLHQLGVHTIAQDEESCVVYGMPREAVELGAASESVSINTMATHLVKLYQKFNKS
jgi:two-component system chemotaxis response regulator CheB